MTETAIKDFSYRFLRDIAQDLSRKDLKFPTFIDASLGVRMALGKKDLSNIELARVVTSEPLLCARVVALANSAALNPSGREVTYVKSAVVLVGQNAVRSLSVTLAMEQIGAPRSWSRSKRRRASCGSTVWRWPPSHSSSASVADSPIRTKHCSPGWYTTSGIFT